MTAVNATSCTHAVEAGGSADVPLPMRYVASASGNTSPNSFTQTVHEGFHVIGPKGQKIMVIGTFHVTMVNGTTIVEVEKGNHEEGEICESGFILTPLP